MGGGSLHSLARGSRGVFRQWGVVMESPSSQIPGGPGNAQSADPLCPEEIPVLEVVPEEPVTGVLIAGQPGAPPTGAPPGASTPMPGSYPPPPPGNASDWPKGYRPGEPMWDRNRGWYYPTPEEWQKHRSARRLVGISHWLGWGGIAMLFIGPPAVARATRGSSVGLMAMGGVAALGLLMAIVGAVIGQIGRAKQNRVI